MQRECSTLRYQGKQAEANHCASAAHVADLRSECNTLTRMADEAERSERDSVRRCSAEIAEMRRECSTLAHMAEEAERIRLARCTDELTVVNARHMQIAEMRSECDVANWKAEHSEQKSRKSWAQFEFAQSEVAALRSECASLREHGKQAEANHCASAAHVADLRSKFDTLTRMADEAERGRRDSERRCLDEIAEMRSECSTLTHMAEKAERMRLASCSELGTVNARHVQIAEMRSECDVAIWKVEQSDQVQSSLRDSLRSGSEEIESLVRERDSLKVSLNKEELVQFNASKEAKRMLEEAQSIGSEITYWKQKAEKAEKEKNSVRDAMKNEVAEWRSECESWKLRAK